MTFYPQRRPYSLFENNTGHTDGRTDLRTDGRTDTSSYRDALSHLKSYSAELRFYFRGTNVVSAEVGETLTFLNTIF